MKATTRTSAVAVEERASKSPARDRSLKLDNVSPALVIEDNYLAALDLVRLLDEWGIDSRCTPRLDAARALARDLRPKLALVDVNLQGGYEGLAFAHELQALYGTKIVFVTGYHVRDLMHRMTGAETMVVLFKPVEREVLEAVLAKISATVDGVC